MRLPTALAPLRHPLFRLLWSANVVVSLGVWMQNTGAGWLMTTLAPNALTVSLVQAATIMPIFLLALPAGALADILDRRLFILATQSWMLVGRRVARAADLSGLTDPVVLLALTFAIGVGAAINGPAWGSVLVEAVPRQDLVQAVTLNGVGFNIARAIGPALAGVFLLLGGPALTFALNAASYLAVVGALLLWRRRHRGAALPPENLVGAMRAGVRFTRHTPAMRAAMVRSAAYFSAGGGAVGDAAAGGARAAASRCGRVRPAARADGDGRRYRRAAAAAGPWPHQPRQHSVARHRCARRAGMALLAVSHHWLAAAVAMLVFGVGWVAASSVAQGAAQLAAAPWVRSRALAFYQLASNGGLVGGTLVWGWLGTRIGLPATLLAASAAAVGLGLLVRGFDIDQTEPAAASAALRSGVPAPEAVAPELRRVLDTARGRVLETQHYRIDPAQRTPSCR